MAAGRHLGFDITQNSAIQSVDPENPTLEPNMKCIGSLVAEIWPFAYHAPLPRRRLYWDQSTDVHNQATSTAMTRNRSDELMQCLHVADNENLGEGINLQ